MRRIYKIILLLLSMSFLTACDVGIRQTNQTEYAVRFRMLPPIFGGGLADGVVSPGQTFVVWPWDSVYYLDTKIKNLEWGEFGQGTDKQRSDYVETRALDGNEVSLAVQIQYYVERDPEKILFLIQNVGTTNEEIEELVRSAARADIRTYMNKLRTAEFFINEAKYKGEADVRAAMLERLSKNGIHVQSVNLKEHRFERVLSDGTIDRSYQERINQVQTLEQQTEREGLRKDTVIADKQREFNNAQAEVNRQVAEAEGFKTQATFKGDAYFESKQNEAQGVLATGQAKAKGLQEQINALGGPGGNAILKLELVRSILQANPTFMLLGQGSKGDNSLEVRKTDTNQLIQQMGVLDALQDRARLETPALKKEKSKE